MRGAAVSEVYGNRRKLNTAPKGRGSIASCENNRQRSAELGGEGRRACPLTCLQKDVDSVLCRSSRNVQGTREYIALGDHRDYRLGSGSKKPGSPGARLGVEQAV